jgi:hypothetical protein
MRRRRLSAEIVIGLNPVLVDRPVLTLYLQWLFYVWDVVSEAYVVFTLPQRPLVSIERCRCFQLDRLASAGPTRPVLTHLKQTHQLHLHL